MSSARLVPHLRPLFPTKDNDDEDNDSSKIRLAVSEMFEIEDFTAASDWEKFAAQIEEVLREWMPVGSAESSDPRSGSGWLWRQEKRSLSFHDFPFCITRHTLVDPSKKEQELKEEIPEEAPPLSPSSLLAHDDGGGIGGPPPLPAALQDMMSSDHDFPAGAHPIHYFYGFYDFVTMTPQGKEDVANQTRIKMALSTATVAVNSTNCLIPFFVQVMDRGSVQYCGVFSSPCSRTSFEMVVYPRGPCNHLSGLLSLFKEKITVPSCECKVTLRKSYQLEDWTFHTWTQSPPDLDLFTMFGKTLGYNLGSLPFGSSKDPIKKLLLHTMWNNISETVVVENSVHSDFDPIDAPLWTVSIHFEEQPMGLLTDYLNEVAAVTQHHETMRQVLGKFLAKKEEMDDSVDKVPAALSRLTGPTYSFSDIIRSGKSSSSDAVSGPIKQDHLNKILRFLFPDSSSSDAETPYPDEFKANFDSNREIYDNFRVSLSSVKSVPVDGLVWRLSIVLAHCIHILGGIKPAAHLLHEFFLEIRYRWETGYSIPGLPSGSPDHSYSLFHQKLQMINCCTERKKFREEKEVSRSHDDDDDNDVHASEEEEEEFFDCDAKSSGEEDDKSGQEKDALPKKDIPFWSMKPEGRKHKFGKLKLLEHSDSLFVPFCQDPPPMTEDQLAEHHEVMIQLGEGTAGSELRTKMQTASLLSDMESFKAANPGSVLGDFVRWYSPRDWIEAGEEGESAKVKWQVERSNGSPRNAWQEAWENAKPVPARRQKRLFDDTKEAEKVLQYLTSLRPGEVVQMLMPTLLHASVHRILLEPFSQAPHVMEIVSETIQILGQMSKLACRPEVQHYNQAEIGDFHRRHTMTENVMRRLAACEVKISQALSLRAKFLKDAQAVKDAAFPTDDEEAVSKHMEDFVRELYTKKEVKVVGASRGPAGQLIRRMFYEAQKAKEMITTDETDDADSSNLQVFPETFSREYILRTSVCRPYPYSRETPQRLYCCMKQGEFRLAGAFTIDKLYL